MRRIAKSIIELAHKKNLTISLCESITGGKISSSLCEVDGSSAVFMGGVIAYSEHAKIHFAGVDSEEMRISHGYSEVAAKMMAERVRSRNISDICMSTTGCAGPIFRQGFENGRVVFGLSIKEKETQVFDEHFSGSREEVQEKATIFALEKILFAIESKE